MNKWFEEYKNNFIKERIYEKRYVDRREAKETKEKVYEELDKGLAVKQYIKVPKEVTEEELEQYIRLRTLENLEEINAYQKDINLYLGIAVVVIIIGFLLLIFR